MAGRLLYNITQSDSIKNKWENELNSSWSNFQTLSILKTK
jgi:hypothetical protein